MATEEDLREAIDAVGEVLDLIERYEGDAATTVTARVRRLCSLLAGGDLDALRSLLSETAGGMGSLNDYGFASRVDEDIRNERNTLMALAAEKCRIALRCRGNTPWR